METKTIQAQSITLKADPTQLLEYVFYLKAQIKLFEQDIKDNEELVIALLNTKGGKIKIEDDEIDGTATVCQIKTYKYSEDINELINKKKEIENKIKAKQIVEIACGAEIESARQYVRYNVEFK